MAMTLRNLENINQTVQQEHASWLRQHLPEAIALPQIHSQQWGILNYPHLWSGSRLFETPIRGQKEKNLSAYEVVQQLIKEAKEHYPELIQDIEVFEKKYQKYFRFLKERCLLLAINRTLKDLETTENTKEITKNFRDVLNLESLLLMQRRSDCLQAHRQVCLLSYALRNITDPKQAQELETIEQLEVLSKRLLDCHYVSIKKMTLKEAFASDLSTLSSLLGLAAGIPAAILGIGGLFFPPLLVPATILGFISFISYISTTISAIRMAYEARQYGRGPSSSDFKWLVIDIVLAPFSLFGSQIFAALDKAFHSIHPIQSIMKGIGYIWNNVFSNVLPDIINTKDIVKSTWGVGALLTRKGALKNTTTATSFQKIMDAFAEQDLQAFNRIHQTKEYMAQQGSETALYGRDFAFIKYKKGEEGLLPVKKSYHGHILLWDAGFMGAGTSAEAQKIIRAVNAYKELKPNDSMPVRIRALEDIIQHSAHYLSLYKENEAKKRFSYVEKLSQSAQKERDNLQKFAEAEDDKEASVVLVGFKAP